jgi:hypothetical protein
MGIDKKNKPANIWIISENNTHDEPTCGRIGHNSKNYDVNIENIYDFREEFLEILKDLDPPNPSEYSGKNNISYTLKFYEFLFKIPKLSFKIDKNKTNLIYNEYAPSILIDALIDPDRAADMHANLADYFPVWIKRHGLTSAHRILKMQIGWMIIGEYWNKALDLIKAIKLGGA